MATNKRSPRNTPIEDDPLVKKRREADQEPYLGIEEEEEAKDDSLVMKQREADQEPCLRIEQKAEDDPLVEKRREAYQEPCPEIEEKVFSEGDSDLEEEYVCHVYRLPPEVVEHIFTYLGRADRKNARLACKSWYDISCNLDVFLCLGSCGRPCNYEDLKNCGFKYLHVSINCNDIHGWPSVVWEKIGPKIMTLKLYNCHLGDHTIRNIISFCDNLQSLQVTMKEYDADRSFCSPETLEELDIVRPKLSDFTIYVQRWRFSEDYAFDYDLWKRIFSALLRIFPNIVQGTSGQLYGNEIYFECRFTASKPTDIDQSELSSSLTYLLSMDDEHRGLAFDSILTSRFTHFTLIFSRFVTNNLQWALLEFIRRQNKLVFVCIRQGLGRGLRVPMSEDSENMKDIIFQVFRFCLNLREFIFSETQHLNHSLERASWLRWLNDFAPEELPYLHRKFSSLETLHLDSSIMKSELNLEFYWKNRWRRRNDFKNSFSMDFLKYHVLIQNLTLTGDVSDEMLQIIFQFMVHLKTLKMRLSADNTSFGLTGRRPNEISENSNNTNTGYSIKNLRHLEKLSIRAPYTFKYDNSLFQDFDFPNLQYLNCFPPQFQQDVSTVSNSFVGMPALVEIAFQNMKNFSMLIVICQTVEKLQTLSLPNRRDLMGLGTAKSLFDSRPSLRIFRTMNRTFYREPFTQQAV